MDDLRGTATPLDRFLHASVGEDRNGNPVTVLSTFARLGLDPWKEASDLSTQPHESARLRLAGLLARSHDVAGSGSGPSVQRLLDLLPPKATLLLKGNGLSAKPRRAIGLGGTLVIVALLLMLLQSFFTLFGGR
jgi:hypothetical protein